MRAASPLPGSAPIEARALVLSLFIVACPVGACVDRALPFGGGFPDLAAGGGEDLGVTLGRDLAVSDLAPSDLAPSYSSDGGPEAGAPDLATPPAVGVPCDGVLCATGQVCCLKSGLPGAGCVQGGTGSSSGCPSAAAYRCDGPEDCSGGRACVIDRMGGTRCRPNPDATDVVACHSDADCAPSQRCLAEPAGPPGAPPLAACRWWQD